MLGTSYYKPYNCRYQSQAGPNQYEVYESGLLCKTVCFLVARILIACASSADVDISADMFHALGAKIVVLHCLLLSSDNNIIQYYVLVCQVLRAV